jgi:hypothetical protein
MIRPLRSAHRVVFCAWILLLPTVFIGGLLSRHQWPATASTHLKQTSQSELLISEKSETAGELKFEVRLLKVPTDPNMRAVEFLSETPVVAPDVLVYWSARRPESNLPAYAQLLGTYHPHQQYRLPSAAKDTGFVVLYSLAQEKLLGCFSLGNQT